MKRHAFPISFGLLFTMMSAASIVACGGGAEPSPEPSQGEEQTPATATAKDKASPNGTLRPMSGECPQGYKLCGELCIRDAIRCYPE